MRLRSLLVLGTAALLLVSGCAPEPTPKPTASPSESATPTPTPTPDPIVEPDAAFDVTCDDVAVEMAALVGEPSTPVEPVMSVIATMNWLSGPAQHMFQRASGVACSAGDDTRYWEVTILPDAQTVIDGATERQGWWGESVECSDGTCRLELVDSDVLLSAHIDDPAVGADDAGRIEEGLRRLVTRAATTVHAVEYIDSNIPGVACDRFLTTQDVNELFGVSDAALFDGFGGWSIPAEVYTFVNGSRICYYTSGDPYAGEAYLQITTLPAGAWAFEDLDGDAVIVEGADAAKESVDADGSQILDVRVEMDWLRFKAYQNASGASADLIPLAERAVRNLTVGHTAPE